MLKNSRFYKYICSLTAILCAGSLFACSGLSAWAAPDSVDTEAALEANRALPIQSNTVPNWPTGPVVGAESAILMDADTGTILYAKNIHEKEYPASTTKILTSLLAIELCEMDEMVTFSRKAVFDNPPGSSGIAMDVGQALTVEQCLNAILIRSANEVAFALAEHITGTSDWSVFSEIMNRRAAELGALNSNFVNPNGLPDENHYTTAYDLAMIGRAFFANEMLCRISLTRRLDIPASPYLPHAKLEISSMEIIPGGKYAYEYLVGCKTGYTNAARSCLVSCAEKDGLKLICVVMRDEAPYQYLDTISLFDYGFANFQKINVSQTETKYNIDNTEPFYNGKNIFGSSQPILSLDKDDSIILPRTVSLEDLKSSVSYNTNGEESSAAVINYSYHNVYVGSVGVRFTAAENDLPLFDTPYDTDTAQEEDSPTDSPVIFINIAKILAVFAVLAVLTAIGLPLHSIIKNYEFSGFGRHREKKDSKRRRRKSYSSSEFKDYDF